MYLKVSLVIVIHFQSCRQVKAMNLLGCSSSEASLPTYYAVQLHALCSDQAAQVILDKLKLDWNKGGGGLIVRRRLPT